MLLLNASAICLGCFPITPPPPPPPQECTTSNQMLAKDSVHRGGGLSDRMQLLLTRISVSGTVFNAIGLSLNAADIITGTLANTIQWGKNDIDRYRAIGLHVTNPIGSIIRWQQIKVNWCEYGSNTDATNTVVLSNFVEDGLNE